MEKILPESTPLKKWVGTNADKQTDKLLSSLNPKEHLKDISTSFVIEELIKLSKVHVVSSGPVRVKNGFMKSSELAKGVTSLLHRAVFQRDILSVSNHNSFPC